MRPIVALTALGLSAAIAIAMWSSVSPTGSAPSRCRSGPIRVGAVATITGPIDFHQVPEATRTVFDDTNAAGGIDGCPIEYVVEDDRGDHQLAAQAARNLVDNHHVDVLVGSASLADCQANAAFYERRGVLALSGMGAEPACFKARNILPLNVGPYALSTRMLTYAAETLKHTRLCAFFVNFGGTAGVAYRQAVEAWERDHRRTLDILDSALPTQADYTSYVLRARNAGCQSVVLNLTESLTVQWVRTAERQRVQGIDWFLLAPVYTESTAKAIGPTGQMVYVLTEWEPLTPDKTAPDGWQRLMAKAGLSINQRTQAGFSAGTVAVEALKALQGRRTRTDIADAVKGVVARHVRSKRDPLPMHAMKMMTLSSGQWRALPIQALDAPEPATFARGK